LLESGTTTYTPATAGTYYAEARNTTTGCISITRTPVTLTINPNPNAPDSEGNQTICANEEIPDLSVTVGVGETADWYDADSGGALLESETTTYTPATAGTYYAEARNTTTGCISITRTPVTLTINPNPNAPDSEGNQTICANEEIPDLSVTVGVDETADWYDADSGGALLESETTTYTPATAGTYYAEARNTTTGCISITRTPVTLTINPNPNAPDSEGNQTICANEEIPDLSVTVGVDETADWYDADSGGALLESGTTTYTPATAGTYYAEARNTTTGCISITRTPVTLTINPNPNAPDSEGNQTICANEEIPDLSVTVGVDETADWYDADSGGALLESGTTTYTPATSGTYYAEARNTTTGCISITRTPVTLTINSNPNAPDSEGNQTICANEEIPDLSVTVGVDETADWYDADSGGALLESETTTYTPATAGIYYAEARNTTTGCISITRTPVTLTINSNPNAPDSEGNQTICANEEIPDLSVTVGVDETADWYDADSGGALLESGTTTYTPATAGTYYAEARNTTTGCISITRTPVTLTINPNPNAPDSEGNQTICANEEIPDLSVTVGVDETADWYDADSGGALLESGTTTYTPATSGTYYAEARNTTTGCISATRTGVTLTINPNPNAPDSEGNQTICANEEIPDLSVIVGVDETADWYDADSGGALLESGTTTYTPATSGTYYAEARNTTTGCISATRTGVTLTINPTPTISATPLTQEICPGAAITNINITNPNIIPETIFSWTRDNTTVLTGLPASGSGATISGNLNSSTPGTMETTVFTIIATANGCESTPLQAEVTVGDTTPPDISCPDKFTQSNDPGECFAIISESDIGTPDVLDNCTPEGDIIVTNNFASLFPDGQVPVGDHVITWTAEDIAGNTATCEQLISVNDDEPPEFTVPNDITIPLASDCSYDVRPDVITGNVTEISDNCTPPTEIEIKHEDFIADGECPGTYIITRVWTLTDQSGNAASKNQTITVADNQAPSLTAPGTIQIECDKDPHDLSITGEPTGSNSCGGDVEFTYTDVIVERSCPQEYDIIRTWKATDCSGNESTREQLIRVRDTTPPLISCPPPVMNLPTVNDVPPPFETVADFIEGGGTVSDNCSDLANIEILFYRVEYEGLEDAAGFCPTKIIRTYRFEDECGRVSYCDHEINIDYDPDCAVCEDNVPYRIVDLRFNPAGVIHFSNIVREGICCADEGNIPGSWHCVSFDILLAEGAVGVEILVDGVTPPGQEWSQDCGPVVMENGIVCIEPGEYRLFTYCKSGQGISQRRNNYTFRSIPGVIVDDEVTTRVNCNTQLSVGDNISNPVWNSIYPGEYGQYNHYLTFPDNDQYNPVFLPDENAPREIEYQVCGDLAESPCVDESGIGCAVITVYVMDEISVEFNVDPGAFCEDEIPTLEPTVFPSGNYTLEWYEGFDATGTLLFTGPTFTPPAAGSYTLRVIYEEGGVLCSELIHNFDVAPDDQPPIVTPPEPIEIECNFIGNPQIIANWRRQVTATDEHTDESDLIIRDDYEGIYQFCSNVLIVTFFAEDECGNIGFATSTITVIDTTPPYWVSISGSLDRTIECNDPVALANAQALTPLANDACDNNATIQPIKTTGEFVPGDCPTEGTYTNFWIARDACENESLIFVQVITVTDNTEPVIDTPAEDLTVECDGVGNTDDLNQWLDTNGGATAYNECGGDIIWSHDFTTLTEGCGNTGEATVIFTATDECGNTATTQATFTIIDTQPPILITPAPDIEVGPDPNFCVVDTENVELIPPVFEDVCDNENVVLTNDAPAEFPPGITIITWTAIDDCGNIATTTHTVTVRVDPPIVECHPEVLTVFSAEDECGANVSVPAPVVTDPCPYTMTNDSEYGTSDTDASGFYPVGTTIVTWTITGTNDYVTTCVQEITVTDLDPWVSCPESIEEAADFGLPYNDAVVIPAPTFGDNCPDPLLTWTMTPPDFFAGEYDAADLSGNGDYPSPNRFYVGVSTITYTVTDSHGNTATCFLPSPLPLPLLLNARPTSFWMPMQESV
jgi:hypothetical protein